MLASIVTCVLLQTKGPEYFSTWEIIENSIRQRYYARDAQKEKMDSLLKEFGPRAKAAKSREEFSASVNEMITRFEDSHFDFVTISDQGFYFMDAIMRRDKSKPMPHIGVWFKKAPSGYEVKMVLNGQAGEEAGLVRGDIVTTINGQPFTPVDSLRPFIGKSANFQWTRRGKTMSKSIAVKEGRPTDMFFEATRRSAKTIEFEGKKYAYLRCWSMIEDRFKQFLTMNVLQGSGVGADGYILDLRDGFGGRPEGYYEAFFGPEMELEWGFGAIKSRQLTGFQRPLVVLTNRGTRSAKEVVSMIFKESGRAILVGDTTAGDVLGTSPMPVSDWAFLEIPMVQLKVDDVTLEDRGVDPHVALTDEYDENGVDLYLKRGLEEVAKLVKEQSLKSGQSPARR